MEEKTGKVATVGRIAGLVTSIGLNMVVGGICAAVIPGGTGVAMKAASTLTALATGAFLGDKIGSYVADEVGDLINGGVAIAKEVQDCVNVIKETENA